jgi:L-asparaginase
MPKVVLLHTGGTLMMRATVPGDSSSPLSPPSPELYGRDLATQLPVLHRAAEVETRIVMSLDSGDMQPADWVTIARAVHDALRESTVDGVVVIHGTDTMAYTASAVALLLGPLPKPVVFTGAQRPLAEVRTDARENLIDAVLLATLPVPEVMVAFASRALRGARATKRDAWAFDAFDTPNCAPLVSLGIGVDVAPHVRPAADVAALAPFDPRLEPSVLAVRVFPGLDPRLLSGALRAGVRGLVLEAYGTGNLPHLFGSLIPVLQEARARVPEVPVVIVSQCLRGFVDLTRYVGGAAAAAEGAISGGDMTVEAAIAKLMIGLGRFGDPGELRTFFATSIIGERST